MNTKNVVKFKVLIIFSMIMWLLYDLKIICLRILNTMIDLRRYIYTKNVGDEVNLTILRNKKEYNIKIKLGKKM